MSSPVLHGCCAIALLALFACSPRTAPVSHHPSAEARNAESRDKKPRKRRPILVAPPPAYGNKIVLDRNRRQGREGYPAGSQPDHAEL
jgi:hypothetical protein